MQMLFLKIYYNCYIIKIIMLLQLLNAKQNLFW